MKALLEQQGLATALEKLSATTIAAYDNVIQKQAYIATGVWKKLETLYMTKSLANRSYFKKKLYSFQMHPGKSQSEYIDEFHKLVGDLAAIDTAILDEDQAFLSLTSLSSSYDNLMTEAKGYGGEGLYVRRRPGQRDMEQGTYSAWSKSQGRSSGRGECRVRGTGKVQVHLRDGSSFVLDNVRYVSELRRNLISLGTLKKADFTVKMQSGKIKVIKGSLVVLSGTRRANCIYILDGQAVTRKTLKGRKQLGEYQTGWKIKTGNVLDFCNQRSPSSAIGFKTSIDMIGFLVGLLVLSKGCLNWLRSSAYSWDTVKVRGQCRCCKELSLRWNQEDHTFEVEPHGNVDHVVGSQEVQTQDLIYYHLVRDREQHSTCELFGYKEDSNEAAFAVAVVEKIYAHELLKAVTIETTITGSIHQAEIWATKGLLDKANGNVLGMEIIRDQSGNTLRVSQSRFYNEKLVQTLLEGHSILSLEGHSILSLEGSLSGDCDVEKNSKWSCIYVIGSQEYLMVCTRLDIAYADVAMRLHIMALPTTEAAYMTLTEAAKEAIWLKGLTIESGFMLKIVAGIATGALSKAIP
ncbi:hypothetical protein Tco_0466124, partial [Tanacetum coccineum]